VKAPEDDRDSGAQAVSVTFTFGLAPLSRISKERSQSKSGTNGLGSGLKSKVPIEAHGPVMLWRRHFRL
jgi:hypothetical protein